MGTVVWFTGLSGSGKTTIARAVERRVESMGNRVTLLDGDEMRSALSPELGFTRQDRDTNVRRLAFVAGLIAKHDVLTLVSAIAPYRQTRNQVLAEFDSAVEVHVDAPLQVLIDRDTKGLYGKALSGEIEHFTGISDPYEAPESPDIHVLTHLVDVDSAVSQVLEVLARKDAKYASARIA